MMGASGLERPCRTIDLSPGDACISADDMPIMGEKLIIYAQHIGCLEGPVTRLGGGEFGVRFLATLAKRERLAETLTELCNSQGEVLGNRRTLRYQGSGIALVEVDGAEALHCEVTDFSLVGMAARTAATRPMIGTWVKIGAMHGRVSRYIENGFAIDFEAKRS
jgi:hypothetical protein